MSFINNCLVYIPPTRAICLYLFLWISNINIVGDGFTLIIASFAHTARIRFRFNFFFLMPAVQEQNATYEYTALFKGIPRAAIDRRFLISYSHVLY